MAEYFMSFAMRVKEILKLLDPKNQNLPALSTAADFKTCPLIYIPVVQGEEHDMIQEFPAFKGLKLSGKKEEMKEVIKNDQVFRFIGLGKLDQVNARTMRRFFGKVYLEALKSKPKQIAMLCPKEFLSHAATGVHVAALDPGMFKSKWEKTPAPEVIFVAPGTLMSSPRSLSFPRRRGSDSRLHGNDIENALHEGQVIAEGKNLMRILGSLPPNVLNQQTYAELCMALGHQWKVTVKRAPQKELKKYELLQAVSHGSNHPSELLIFRIEPKKKSKHATALIGKGLCYDSGGIIDKQDHMKFMKEDMAGSASVLATILVLVKNKWPIRETTYFFLPIAQNMMGSKAMRADDVYTAGDGQKVEVTHTDAEGRLVLADTICYAKNHFPEIHRYMTIATLTGSCVRALGDVYTGLVSNNRSLAKEMELIGKETGDYLFAGPWDLEYDDYICPVADVPNVGENAGEAGWIKGALFMNRFIPKTEEGEPKAQYAHLDIAGTIDMYEKGKPWRRKGFNSGVGVGLLAKLLSE
ncbi:MAG: leucyl aminopeptidase family protein [Candidatus Peregrinibacteria bacterium]